MTCGVGVVVEIMVFLRKLNATSNSFSKSLLHCFSSKILVSFTIGAHKASSFT
jgi:hypothetical protein